MLKNEMQIIVTLPHKEFMERLQNFFQETLTTVDEKARNYNGAQDDAFFTARVIEHFGVCDAKTSIVARIIEKVARLASLYKKGNGTKDESLYDTLEDICGHVGRLAILISLEEEIDGEAVEDEGEIRGTGSRQVVQGIWLEGGE